MCSAQVHLIRSTEDWRASPGYGYRANHANLRPANANTAGSLSQRQQRPESTRVSFTLRPSRSVRWRKHHIRSISMFKNATAAVIDGNQIASLPANELVCDPARFKLTRMNQGRHGFSQLCWPALSAIRQRLMVAADRGGRRPTLGPSCATVSGTRLR